MARAGVGVAGLLLVGVGAWWLWPSSERAGTAVIGPQVTRSERPLEPNGQPRRAVAPAAAAEPERAAPARAEDALDRRELERLAEQLLAGEPEPERLLASARALLERAAARASLPPETLPLVVPLGEGATLRVLRGRSGEEAGFQLELPLEAVPQVAFARGGVREGIVGSELELRLELGPEGARSFLAVSQLRPSPELDLREANADAGPLRLGGLMTADGRQALWMERALDARRRGDGVVEGAPELGEARQLGPLALDDPELAALLRRFLPRP